MCVRSVAMSTDTANVVVNSIVAFSELSLAGMALYSIRSARRETRDVREAAEAERKANDRARRDALHLDLALKLSAAFEDWLRLWRVGGPGTPQGPQRDKAVAETEARIRSALTPLPLRELGLFRWQFEVWPDQRDAALYHGAGHPDVLHGKMRDQLLAYVYRLSGLGTNQDYEPPGSPTGSRPRRPPEEDD